MEVEVEADLQPVGLAGGPADCRIRSGAAHTALGCSQRRRRAHRYGSGGGGRGRCGRPLGLGRAHAGGRLLALGRIRCWCRVHALVRRRQRNLAGGRRLTRSQCCVVGRLPDQLRVDASANTTVSTNGCRQR